MQKKLYEFIDDDDKWTNLISSRRQYAIRQSNEIASGKYLLNLRFQFG